MQAVKAALSRGLGQLFGGKRALSSKEPRPESPKRHEKAASAAAVPPYKVALIGNAGKQAQVCTEWPPLGALIGQLAGSRVPTRGAHLGCRAPLQSATARCCTWARRGWAWRWRTTCKRGGQTRGCRRCAARAAAACRPPPRSRRPGRWWRCGLPSINRPAPPCARLRSPGALVPRSSPTPPPSPPTPAAGVPWRRADAAAARARGGPLGVRARGHLGLCRAPPPGRPRPGEVRALLAASLGAALSRLAWFALRWSNVPSRRRRSVELACAASRCLGCVTWWAKELKGRLKGTILHLHVRV